MQRRGFSRTITGDNGVAYELPPAEYYIEGNAPRGDVLEKAKAAAASVKPGYDAER
jgi:hypothetical protein